MLASPSLRRGRCALTMVALLRRGRCSALLDLLSAAKTPSVSLGLESDCLQNPGELGESVWPRPGPAIPCEGRFASLASPSLRRGRGTRPLFGVSAFGEGW